MLQPVHDTRQYFLSGGAVGLSAVIGSRVLLRLKQLHRGLYDCGSIYLPVAGTIEMGRG